MELVHILYSGFYEEYNTPQQLLLLATAEGATVLYAVGKSGYDIDEVLGNLSTSGVGSSHVANAHPNFEQPLVN